MQLLLDTHTLIWALCEPEKLGSKVITLLSENSNVAFVSVASLWEIQIKRSLGKIKIPDEFMFELQECGYELLNITPNHIEKLEGIPLLHKDPFDRLLIAQSIYENIPLITKDSDIMKYNLKIIKF